MKAAAFALLVSASAAWGQDAVRVRSGDHPGFTRLAMDLPQGRDWQFGRVEGGYGLKIADVTLDTSRVFRMIGRQRLARLDADGADGLRLGIDCACHATAFTTARGTLVIDIRRGEAPEGSAFEAPLNPPPAPAPAPAPLPGYDWHELPREPAALAATTLDPLRDALLRKLSDGAARGVVDMVDRLPEMPERPDPPSQIRVAEAPGFLPDPAQPLTQEGRTCIADDRIAIAGWGNDLSPAEGMALARTGLVGEFDQPDAEAVSRAIRYHLHLGFGAEARQLARLFPVAAGDRALWEAMANIMDGRPQTTGVLDTMTGCDSDVAMWGILAAPRAIAGQPEQTEAALRAFEALPVHLRQHLGPQLAERFAARHDANAALMVRTSVERGETTPTNETRLMTALADESDARLAALVAEGGTQSSEALIALADRRLASGQRLDGPMVTALAALRHERGDEGRVARLHELGMASIGDFSALAATKDKADLWAWLARTEGDEAVLAHAVLPKDAPLPDATPQTRLAIADRLTTLGLPAPALIWLERGDRLAQAGAEERLAAARALMMQRDARTALPLIAGMEGEAAETIRTAALAQLGTDPTPLPEATTLLAPAATEGGALARSRALVEEAASARAHIDTLLQRVPSP